MADIDIDLGLATEPTLSLIKDKLPSKHEDGGALVHVTNQSSSDVTDRPTRELGKVSIAGGTQVDALTDVQLRAAPVPVVGPVTDVQLRASALPVSGPATDVQLRATPLPVAGPLTDVQLRAARVPVDTGLSIPSPQTDALTNAQLRSSAVPVSGPLTDTQLRASKLLVTPDPLATRYLAADGTTLTQVSATNPLPVVVPAGSTLPTTWNSSASGTFSTVGDTITIAVPAGATTATMTVIPPTNVGGTGTAAIEASWDGTQWIQMNVALAQIIGPSNSTTSSNFTSATTPPSATWALTGSGTQSCYSFTSTIYGAKFLRARYTSSQGGVNKVFLSVSDSLQREVSLKGFANPGADTGYVAGTVQLGGTSTVTANIATTISGAFTRTGALTANTAVSVTGQAFAGFRLYLATFNADQPLVVSVQQSTQTSSTGTWRNVTAPVTMQGDATNGYSAQLLVYIPYTSQALRPYIAANANACTYAEVYAQALTR